MLRLERSLHETLPIGPEEAQRFYIQKQIEKGLPPLHTNELPTCIEVACYLIS